MDVALNTAGAVTVPERETFVLAVNLRGNFPELHFPAVPHNLRA